MSKHTVVIDRNKWYRGEGSIFSRLYSNRGLCCLGFDALSRGICGKDIKGLRMPYNLGYNLGLMDADASTAHYEYEKDWRKVTANNALIEEVAGLPSVTRDLLGHVNVRVGDLAQLVNDEQGISEDYREELIKRIFAELDIEVKFVN